MPTEQFKHGASPHAEVREEHELPRDDGIREERDQALLPQRLSAGEYEVWRKDKAVETFGPIAWRLIESCFGKESLGQDFAAALWTDSAYPEQPGLGDIGVLFGSTQQDRKRGPTAFGRSAGMSQLIASSCHRGEQIGVLVHYRPAYSHFLDFAGVPLETESVVAVERFANERLHWWRKLSQAPDFAPPPVAVHTAFEHEQCTSLNVFVSAPPAVLAAAGISPSSTYHRCSTTGAMSLAQWSGLDRVLTGMLRTVGGEVTEALTSLSQAWQAREVSKRHVEVHTSERTQSALVSSIPFPHLEGLKPPEAIREFNTYLDVLRAPTRKALQAYLDSVQGNVLTSFQEKKQFAAGLGEALKKLGLRVECETCHEPASLRAERAGTAAEGVFRFEHVAQGRRQRHADQVTIPKLKLVLAPPDPRRKS